MRGLIAFPPLPRTIPRCLLRRGQRLNGFSLVRETLFIAITVSQRLRRGRTSSVRSRSRSRNKREERARGRSKRTREKRVARKEKEEED